MVHWMGGHLADLMVPLWVLEPVVLMGKNSAGKWVDLLETDMAD